MSDLLITIAIPTYNNEKTIEKAISSCLRQETDINYEVLIVDDASTDSTPKILAQYDDPKIRVVTLDKRVPLIVNHNLCLQNSMGKYVLFCHADDALEEHAIKFYNDKLQKRLYPKKYIVWGHSMFRDYSAKAIDQAGFSYNEIVVGEYAPIMFLYGGLTPSGTLYSRETFLEMGAFLEVTMNAAPTDMTTMIHLAMNGFRFEMVDEMLFYRVTSSTALSSENPNIYLDELDDAFKSFIDHIEKEKLSKLINLAATQNKKPFYFFYAMAQSSVYRPQIKKIILRHLLKYPWQLRNHVVQQILKRVF